ncbi:MAG: glycosyltransferase family 2 protein [Candidatus Gastranaerophilaceae bacterium]
MDSLENIEKIKNESQTKYDISVIIVNWNSGDYLKQTIESLEAFSENNNNNQVILIDNYSNKKDSSIKYIDEELTNKENYLTIKLDKNLGFGSANNLGIKISKSKYVLLLNPDVIIKNDILKILSDYLDKNPKVGMIGPKVLNEDGSFQISCMRGEPNPEDVFCTLSGLSKLLKNNPNFNRFSLFHLNREQIQNVAGLSGCCMMVRRELIEEIGEFDEQFFLYQEETDLCWRAYKAGWSLVYNPEAEILHYKGITTRQKLLKNNLIFTQSMMKFFEKHHWKNYNFFQKVFWTVLICGNFVLKYLKMLIRW